MNKKYITAAEVTEAVIADWKAKHPSGIAEIFVLADDSTDKHPKVLYKGWLRKPTRNEMRELMSLNTDPVTYTERILDLIWLGGDEQLKTDDEAFYAIMPQVQKVMEIKEAQLKKL